MEEIKKILIVCTGNSCRSIMAEGYLAAKLREKDLHDIHVLSAGTHAANGIPPTEETVQVMKENGIDVSGFVSTVLTKILIDNADAILVMEPMHKSRVLDLSPTENNKIYYLRGFSSEKKRKNIIITDPIGKPIEFYRTTFELIKDSIDGFLQWLKV